MLSHLFYLVYVTKFPAAILMMFLLLTAWSVFGAVFYKKLRIICAVLAILYAAVILYATVFSRSRTVTSYDFMPFSSFQKAVEQPEFYRSMLMNTFLFEPLGLMLPFVFKGSAAKRVMLTILTGLILSVCVEAIQFFFSLGQAETDDVICNTVGTALGSCAYLLSLLWRRLVQKIRKGKKSDE